MINFNLELFPRDYVNETILNKCSTYTEKYNFIIKYYQSYNEKLNCYCERHHIIPKSIGGTNQKENLVMLPACMHYVVHFLLPFVMQENHLTKEYFKMLCAFNLFNPKKENLTIYNLIQSSYEYGLLREAYSKHLSKKFQGRSFSLQTLENMSLAQKRRFSNAEEREKIRKVRLGKKSTAETRDKISKSLSKMYLDHPEYKQHHACKGIKLF